MLNPTLEEIKYFVESESFVKSGSFAGSGSNADNGSNCAYKNYPVYSTLLSDVRTPVEVLRILRNVSSHVYMLESVSGDEKFGRYTFLGYDPKTVITCLDGKLKLGDVTIETRHPEDYIRQLLAAHKSPKVDGLPPFTGGLVGYFAYDYLKYPEPSLHLDAKDSEGFNDFDLMLFDKVIAFDNQLQKIFLIANISLDNIDEEYNMAGLEIRRMEQLILHGEPKHEAPGILKSDFRSLFSKEEYCEKVEKVKNYIHEGDIFQLVLSNRLEADFEGSLLDTYRVLRTINPSPYMFYISGTDVEIAGASPETLTKLENGVLHTFPLAGSRPRGKTYEEDMALEKDLLSDPKELSEHNMLVDLGRNDIGRISEFGTVEVERYHDVLKYSHIMHIGSTVRGIIRDDCDAVDAIDSILPAGTLSGAPKIRACQLINDLEDNKRGIYGGAIGYLDFTGNMDTCIAIRTAYKKNGKVFIRSGAGIVADSVPEKEYEECNNKATAVINALNQVMTTR